MVFKSRMSFGFTTLVLLFLLALPTCPSNGQEASGLYYVNFSGIHGVIKNPGFGLHGYLGWDVNLVSAHGYFQNNYAHVSNSNLFHFLNNQASLSVINIEDPPSQGESGIVFNNQPSHFISTIADVVGPSLFYDFGFIGIGVFTRARVQGGINNIPVELGYHSFQNLNQSQEYNIPDFDGGFVGWMEYGLNLALKPKTTNHSYSLGLTLKYLSGYQGIYGFLSGGSSFSKLAGNTIQIDRSSAELAFTNVLSNTSDLSFAPNGTGISVDLGMSAEIEEWRFGIAILDIGAIRFNTNSEVHRLVINESFQIPLDNISDRNSIAGGLQEINNLVATQLSNQDSTLVGSSYRIGMPTSIHLTADYMIRPSLYVFGGITHGVRINKRSLKSEASLTIAPRFEKRWITVSAPLSLDRFQYFRPGLSLRLGILTVGSDDLLSLFGRSDFNGSSIYAAIKINPFNNKKAKNGSSVRCPKVKKSPWNSHAPVESARN